MIDPGAKIGESGGDNRLCLLLAVELFAVAPEIFKRRESITIDGNRAFGAYLLAAKLLLGCFIHLVDPLKGAWKPW